MVIGPVGRRARVRFGASSVTAWYRADDTLVVETNPLPRRVAAVSGPNLGNLGAPMILLPHSVDSWLRLRGYGPSIELVRGKATFQIAEERLGPPGELEWLPAR